MPDATTPWYRFHKPSKQEWGVVLIVIVATALLFGTWELLGLPEQTLPFVAGGVAVGVGLLIRFLNPKETVMMGGSLPIRGTRPSGALYF